MGKKSKKGHSIFNRGYTHIPKVGEEDCTEATPCKSKSPPKEEE